MAGFAVYASEVPPAGQCVSQDEFCRDAERPTCKRSADAMTVCIERMLSAATVVQSSISRSD